MDQGETCSNDGGGGGRFFQRRKPCRFCVDKAPIDFKDIGLFRNFLTERGELCRGVFQGIAYAISAN